MTKEEQISEINPDAMLADGFEDAIIGVVEQFGCETIALYDKEKCIEILIKQGMDEEEAIDYFYFNIIGAWVGNSTPCYATIFTEGTDEK